MNPEEEAFHAILDADPDDFTTRLVFADWLDERNDERAAGYRALGHIGLWPTAFAFSFGGGPRHEPPNQYRFHNGRGNQNGVRVAWYHALPPAWFRAMRHGHRVYKVAWVFEPPEYGSTVVQSRRRQLEDYVARGFARLPADVQSGLVRAGVSRLRAYWANKKPAEPTTTAPEPGATPAAVLARSQSEML